MLPSNNEVFGVTPPSYRVASAPAGGRPAGVTALAILKLLGVVFAVASIWFYQTQIDARLEVLNAPRPAGISQNDEFVLSINRMTNDVTSSAVARLRILQVVTALEIPFGLALAWGLWKMRGWARSLAIGLACLSIALGIAGMCLTLQMSVPLGIIFNGFVIWYLRRDNVRDAFGAY